MARTKRQAEKTPRITELKKKQKVDQPEPDKNVLTPAYVKKFFYKMVDIEANYVTEPGTKAMYREWMSEFKRKLANTTDHKILEMASKYTKKAEVVLDHQITATRSVRKGLHEIRVDAFPDEVGAEQNGEWQPIEVTDEEEDEEEDEEDEVTDEMPGSEEEEE